MAQFYIGQIMTGGWNFATRAKGRDRQALGMGADQLGLIRAAQIDCEIVRRDSICRDEARLPIWFWRGIKAKPAQTQAVCRYQLPQRRRLDASQNSQRHLRLKAAQ